MGEIRKLNAEVVAISNSGPKDVKRSKEALKIDYILIPGPLPQLSKQYGVYDERTGFTSPATMIIDRAGKLRWQYIGSGNDHHPSVTTLIEELRKLQ